MEDEENKSSHHQSQQASRNGDLNEADEDEEESGSDDETSRVFYKASELIVSCVVNVTDHNICFFLSASTEKCGTVMAAQARQVEVH